MKGGYKSTEVTKITSLLKLKKNPVIKSISAFIFTHIANICVFNSGCNCKWLPLERMNL